MIRSLFFAMLVAFTNATAHAHDRAMTSGPSFGLGAGFESAGLGGHALYYLQLPSKRWRLAPHAGVGWFGRAAASGGVMAAFGRRHRLVLDLLVSPAAAAGSTRERARVDYGISALAGWEWMASYGVALRTTFGLSYRPKLTDEEVYFGLNLLSIDYKLW